MEIVMLAFYVVGVFLTLKFIKNVWFELGILTIGTILLKIVIGDGSFYPMFAMPVILSLRYKKPYSLIYTFVVVLFVNIFSGFGIWTIGQLLAYSGICSITFLIKKRFENQNKMFLFLYNFGVMFMFGVFMDIFSFYTGNIFGYPNVVSQIIAGIPFDVKYGMSGIIYGSLFMAVTYISSVSASNLLDVRKMTLEKQSV